MVNYFVKGGPFMWPIMILLVIGLVIALIKLFMLLASGKNAGKLMQQIKKALAVKGREGALDVVKSGTKPLDAVMAAGLRNYKFGMENAEKAIINEGGIQSTYLDKGMIWMSTIVALAPMLGFLGTVWGMVGAMDAIASANDISPSIVAGGISEALLTTAFGLVVAIIIQTLQNVYSTIIDGRILDIEESGVTLIETLQEFEAAK